jgi:parallel beta-helix repeat protein
VISDFSDENTVQYNILRQNGVDQLEGGGIFIANGNANVIRDNAANGNFDGISLSVNIKSSIIQNNTTNGNISVGIAVGAGSTLNQIRTNTARGNGVVDLSDGNVGCAANVWKKNIFATDVVAGVPDGGPGTGCIR